MESRELDLMILMDHFQPAIFCVSFWKQTKLSKNDAFFFFFPRELNLNLEQLDLPSISSLERSSRLEHPSYKRKDGKSSAQLLLVVAG